MTTIAGTATARTARTGRIGGGNMTDPGSVRTQNTKQKHSQTTQVMRG